MKKIVCLLLILVLSLSLMACSMLPPEPEESKDVSASREELLKYLNESSGMWELAQRFFDDAIIYKSKLGGWSYAEVDKSLPLSNYNWDNLRHAGPINNTEWEYYEGSELKSIKGIDISHYNTVQDWEKVANDGVKFAIIRCGYRGYEQGTLQDDKNFEENVVGALKNNIAVGTYFVTQAITVEEAIEEANWVIEKIRPYNITWPVVLDLEDSSSLTARARDIAKADRTEMIKAFCETIKDAGYTPALYSNIRWYLDEMDLTQLTEYDKWFAQYFNRPFFPYEFYIWQYTNTGVVKGIKGDVDLNISFKDYGNK